MTCVTFDARTNRSKHLSPARLHLTARCGLKYSRMICQAKKVHILITSFFSHQSIDWPVSSVTNLNVIQLVHNKSLPVVCKEPFAVLTNLLAALKKRCFFLVVFSITLVEPNTLQWPHGSNVHGDGLDGPVPWQDQEPAMRSQRECMHAQPHQGMAWCHQSVCQPRGKRTRGEVATCQANWCEAMYTQPKNNTGSHSRRNNWHYRAMQRKLCPSLT